MSSEISYRRTALSEGVARLQNAAASAPSAKVDIPAFVINLDSDKKLWEGVSERAEKYGVELHRVKALDGRKVALKDWVGVDIEAFRHFNGREILPGEYGCYRSHLLALQQFLDDGRPYGLILEDDATITETTAARVQAIVETVRDFDVIKLLNHRTKYLISACTTPANDQVGRSIVGRQGSAAAYLVSRAGAERLLQAIGTMVLPYDVALERFWDTDVRVLSVGENVLELRSRPDGSNISPKGYGETKLPHTQRLPRFAFGFTDGLIRLNQVFKRPDWMRLPHSAAPISDGDLVVREGSLARPDREPGTVANVVTAITVLAFLSVLWFERDVYRYFGVAAVVVALLHYFRRDMFTYGKTIIGWMGWACIAWGFWVAARLAYAYANADGRPVGTAEGIYLLPLLYPTFGYALLLMAGRPARLVAQFMLLSLLFLVVGADFHAIFRGLRAETWLFNNTIHAALAAGFIMLASIPFVLYSLRRDDISPWIKSAFVVLGSATFLMAAANVVVLESKGVWLGLAVALPVLFVTVALTERQRATQLAAAAALALALFAGSVGYSQIWNVSDDTVAATQSVIDDVESGRGVFPSGAEAIADDKLPLAFRIRLELMANAIRLWEQNPLLGQGPDWLPQWAARPYKLSEFHLLHNGYLEVLIRYGLLGMAFYIVLYGWSIRQVLAAAKAGLIDWSAAQFYISGLALFAIALLSNSHIRLATGEALMWLAASFGFYCNYLLQKRELARQSTWF